MWFDQMAIPADAPHVEEAHEFLNYMHEAGSRGQGLELRLLRQRQQGLAGSSSTRRSCDDPAIYPDEATLAKLFTVTPYDSEDAARWSRAAGPRSSPASKPDNASPAHPRRALRVWRRAIGDGDMKSLGNIRRDFAPWNDPAAKPYIQFENVTKRFGDFTAVDNLSLDIYEREFFALLGRVGLRQVDAAAHARRLRGADRRPASCSTARICAGIPPYRRPVNMMFQSYALFPHMTVEKQHRLRPQAGRHAEGRDRRRASREMLKLVKLEQFAKRKPHQLSGGQRQRVALARSLAKRPKVLLLDEPLGALDKKLREETQFELMDLQQKLGLTFVVVTHDQEEAMTMADRIAVMDKGEVMQVATPAEIYEAPNSRFVADFVGDVNMFEGKVEAAETAPASRSPAPTGSTIRTDNAGEAPAGADVAFAIRPGEDQGVVEEAGRAAVNAVEGEVYDIAYLGDMTVFHVKLGDGQVVRASTLNAHARRRGPARAGTTRSGSPSGPTPASC